MGLFGFGGVSHNREESAVRSGMKKIGAYEGNHSENCENCTFYASPREVKSNYYGGCRKHQIKVFSNKVCSSFKR